MRLFLLLVAVLLIIACSYYQFFYPPSVLKRATNHALQDFAGAVATKDRAKISAALQALLADDAHIHLEVSFFSLSQPQGAPIAQDFDKPTFVTFIDNTLYSLQDYQYRAELRSLEIEEDRHNADVMFDSQEWADGLSYYAGMGVAMRFSSDTHCQAEVIITGQALSLKTVTCHMQLRTAPKPGEESKLRSPEALREILR